MSWWGTREAPSERMIAEILAMKQMFPVGKPTVVKRKISWDRDFVIFTKKLELVTNDGNPYWLISLRMFEQDGKKSKEHKIRIQYKDDFPSEEPLVTLPGERIRDVVPHHYRQSDNICLHGYEGTRLGWDPAKDTTATTGLWTVEWIRAWTRWKNTGQWPESGGVR